MTHLSQTDDMLLANLDDPIILDKKLPQKSSFARHKSIAIQPNSSITYGPTESNLNNLNSGSNTKISEASAGIIHQPLKPNEPSTPKSSSTTAPMLVRHKSMPSPNGKIYYHFN